MPCSIVTQVEEVVAAYQSLRDRCAPDAPAPYPETCVVPLLLDIVRLASDVAAGDYGITETVSRPTIPACLTEAFLVGTKAWIEGMICSEPSNVIVHLWFISELGAEYSIRLVYDEVPTSAAPGFEEGSGQIVWYNLVSTALAVPGAHEAVLTGYLLADPAEWLTLWDPSISRWLLEVDIGTRKKYFVSRSDETDAGMVEAWAELGITASFDTVGSVALGTSTNTWSFTLPEDVFSE